MKKPPFIILTLALTLTACAPTATATPAPATATPLPTETPIPSPTPLPLTWVKGTEADCGVELPADLFDLLKDRNPLLSADGEQILDAETNEVLLEKKDGEWQESPFMLAINEYGMPEEQAQKLEGLNVNFEVITKYVDGVLVTDAETGADAFYYKTATETLVAVDRFEGTDDVEQINFVISEAEAKSLEYDAWLDYIAATKLEFDLAKINNVPMWGGVAGGFYYINYKGENNFLVEGSAPFDRNPGVLMIIDLPAERGFTEHVLMPVAYLDVQTEKVFWVKVVIRGSAESIGDVMLEWRDKMNITLLITSVADFITPPKVLADTQAYLAARGETVRDRTIRFKGHEGNEIDLSALSDPEIILPTLAFDSKRNR